MAFEGHSRSQFTIFLQLLESSQSTPWRWLYFFKSLSANSILLSDALFYRESQSISAWLRIAWKYRVPWLHFTADIM